jgi:hypothetical protein
METLFPDEWLKIAGSAIFFTSPGSAFARSRVRLPTANKIIEGKQMTICFHVDDCKLSHRKKKVMDTMIEYLREGYESIFKDGTGEMTMSRGKIHKYLGMTLDFTVCGQVKITMFDYVDEIPTDFDNA